MVSLQAAHPSVDCPGWTLNRSIGSLCDVESFCQPPVLASYVKTREDKVSTLHAKHAAVAARALIVRTAALRPLASCASPMPPALPQAAVTLPHPTPSLRSRPRVVPLKGASPPMSKSVAGATRGPDAHARIKAEGLTGVHSSVSLNGRRQLKKAACKVHLSDTKA